VIRLRLSRRALRAAARTALVVGSLVGLYGLGRAVTPRDSLGQPLVLSPSLRETERYRSRARGWVEQMVEVDDRLTALLAEEEAAGQAELYAQSQEIQDVGETAAGLAREAGEAGVPVALVGLRDRACAAADVYLEAALQTAHWLSAPSEEGRRRALAALRTARALRVEIEQSRWLTTD
jgi:hypothetical protein